MSPIPSFLRPALASAVVCLVLPGAAAAETAPLAPLAERVDSYLQPFVDAGHLSGYLLVARGE